MRNIPRRATLRIAKHVVGDVKLNQKILHASNIVITMYLRVFENKKGYSAENFRVWGSGLPGHVNRVTKRAYR